MKIHIKENEHLLLLPTNSEAEITRLQEELLHERDRTLRALADFKNYQHRVEREGNKIADASKREIFLSLLYIIDDMEKALEYANDTEHSVVKGMHIIHQKILRLLETFRILPFECKGMPFTHDLHEAVAISIQKGMKPGIVVDELRRGYLWKSELLRAAQVRVSGEETEPDEVRRRNEAL